MRNILISFFTLCLLQLPSCGGTNTGTTVGESVSFAFVSSAKTSEPFSTTWCVYATTFVVMHNGVQGNVGPIEFMRRPVVVNSQGKTPLDPVPLPQQSTAISINIRLEPNCDGSTGYSVNLINKNGFFTYVPGVNFEIGGDFPVGASSLEIDVTKVIEALDNASTSDDLIAAFQLLR